VSIPTVAVGWPAINRETRFKELLEAIQQPQRRLYVTGRRRIGKTFFIRKVANDHLKGKKAVLYLLAPDNKDLANLKKEFYHEVKRKMERFDSAIVVPETDDVKDVIIFLAWLLKSGVWVIIDEFQRLSELSHLFQVCKISLLPLLY
jgi:AAA+ ATPase superfamily predicted ATPase